MKITINIIFVCILLTKLCIGQQSQVVEFQNQLNDNSKTETLKIIVDSDLKFEEALSGQNIPANVKSKLELVTVFYYGFDDNLHKGQLLVHKDVAQDLKEIFDFIFETKFPIEKVVPISKYKWSDAESMKDNNTSSFNYRFVSGSRILSMHANGMAIDINPKLNPYVKNGTPMPVDAVYDTSARGTINASSELVKEFKKRGWTWGGDWKSLKDYQHFQKNID